MQNLKRFLVASLIVTIGSAMSLNARDTEDTCSNFETVDPITWVAEGSVIENKIIFAPPDTDIALKITRSNVIVRNVIIYHPANGMGIYGW